MAKFDVCRLDAGILVLDCQADLLSDLRTRLVVPLVPSAESWGGVRRLNPAIPFLGAARSSATGSREPRSSRAKFPRWLPRGSRSDDRQCAGYADLGVLGTVTADMDVYRSTVDRPIPRALDVE